MSDLAILSDAELDAVSGGTDIDVTGTGGAGGTASNGAFISGGDIDVSRSNLSVNRSTATANGGAGILVSVRLGRG